MDEENDDIIPSEPIKETRANKLR
jgi:ubiquitin carboxyl-terminal hydrolase 4/11/15